ncbi:hypothetical protein AC578_2576 [Pseudocercospora eumusae]|uniref:Uncharacterized protein n=1 Tax=Pseudocercospora eumusae TaxID=321146 RepID=A0A139GYK1_9PEZI|nr:hypothetical protein AC578_2576 [Pseudocercospora eumusae]
MQFFTTAAFASIMTTAILANPLQAFERNPLAPRTSDSTIPFPFDTTPENIISLASAFDFLAHIPDTVLESGDEATATWIHEHSSEYVPELEKRVSAWQIAKCAWELASTAMPAGKLLKLKRAIDAAGGATNAAKKLLNAKSLAAAKMLGSAFVDIIDVISGFKGIREECFGWI